MGGWPSPPRITIEDEAFIVATAKARPEKAGRPFSHWSIRKLREYLENNKVRRVGIGRERLRQILDRHGVTFQRTKTWEESAHTELHQCHLMTSETRERSWSGH